MEEESAKLDCVDTHYSSRQGSIHSPSAKVATVEPSRTANSTGMSVCSDRDLVMRSAAQRIGDPYEFVS